MKAFLTLVLINSSIAYVYAQATTLVLKTSMFSTDQQINLASVRGWTYHAGHNPAWANLMINTTGWIKRNPGELSIIDANQNGRAEGWFRIKIKLDSSFKDIPVWFRKGGWAATELYVDGRRLIAYGNTGTNGNPYQEYYPLNPPLTAAPLPWGQPHLIAIHVVDYPSPFAAGKLKSETDLGINQSELQLIGPQYQVFAEKLLATLPQFYTFRFAVSMILTILIWLLVLQNLVEKQVVQWLAIQSSLATLTCGYDILGMISGSFLTYSNLRLANALMFMSVAMLPIILLQLVKHPLTTRLTRLLLLLPILAYSIDLLTGSLSLTILVFLLVAVALLYALFSSWKHWRGAQWAIVCGLVLALLAAIVFMLTIITSLNIQYTVTLYIANILPSVTYFIAIPLSFLIYFALRFKEIMGDVREKAIAVVQVTQEKQYLLATQNQRLEEQVEARTAQLNQSLMDLQTTQAQLIQKEKLASLGELTAGIAHEIQNPLNFVNNFSEVSTELVFELKDELDRGDTEEARAIADDLAQNLQKITHHGGRASSIVKGMLEHSRTTTGEKQPTDLNALAEEYLRLAYQGIRAKNKDGSTGVDHTSQPDRVRFTCKLITDFDADLGTVDVVSQDIGRVLLNLYNNAFYAVQARQQASLVDYQPIVRVSTKLDSRQVLVQVCDNGTGIPEWVKTKVFQPFFTTKPTGEGTGLGLSLSYDIVTKGYGGKITVESEPNQETIFTISLPQD